MYLFLFLLVNFLKVSLELKLKFLGMYGNHSFIERHEFKILLWCLAINLCKQFKNIESWIKKILDSEFSKEKLINNFLVHKFYK